MNEQPERSTTRAQPVLTATSVGSASRPALAMSRSHSIATSSIPAPSTVVVLTSKSMRASSVIRFIREAREPGLCGRADWFFDL